ncbi:hypothetical protein GEMRC1_002785 [Eukaryota sp. GEM-RC1]
MEYIVDNCPPPPVMAKVSFTVANVTDESTEVDVSIMITPKSLPDEKVFDLLSCSFPLQSNIMSVSLNATVGAWSKKTAEGTGESCLWKIGKIPLNKSPVLSGTIVYSNSVDDVKEEYGPGSDFHTPVSIQFSIPSYSLSGLAVDHLHVGGEIYKAFKGVKHETLAGEYWVRSKRT